MYELEPIVSDIGRAVFASVAAYVVGSIAIDIQTRAGRALRTWYDRIRAPGEHFALRARSDSPSRAELTPFKELPLTSAGEGILKAAFAPVIPLGEPWPRILHAETYIEENRDVLKARLLDLSPSLHSEVDRPDSEATFRMAVWPPLVAVALYLAAA